ncbi:MAG: N-acetylglucosamine-6-phosphate deacetylase [Bacteroidales bacterium]|nr:N-acetylglucosamine-6-phosphate deacetylase [Bacteroidales bacterium]
MESKNRLLKIYNGQVVTPYRIINNGTVIIKNGIIEEIAEGNPVTEGATEINAEGNYIAPGFIDIHLHGGGGCDFMDATEEAFLKIAEKHAQFGTTSMVPTTLAGAKEELVQTLDLYEQADKKNINGSQFLGVHLEGPYFAMSQKGAQNPKYITNPNPEDYKEILARYPFIRRWSSAPELEGALDFGKYLTSNGVIAAIAHTDASYDEVVKAFENGYNLITHLYSGMSGVFRKNAFRYAGVIESAYLIDEMKVEVICDGIHLPAPLLKLIYKIKGPDKIALVTDSMRNAGMPDGESILGSLKNGLKVIVEDGVAKLPDRTAFAGSVATTDRLVRTMIQLGEVPLKEAVRMATVTPATIMGVDDKKGSLVPGKDADIVIFDQNINIKKTIIKGKVVYSHG